MEFESIKRLGLDHIGIDTQNINVNINMLKNNNINMYVFI